MVSPGNTTQIKTVHIDRRAQEFAAYLKARWWGGEGGGCWALGTTKGKSDMDLCSAFPTEALWTNANLTVPPPADEARSDFISALIGRLGRGKKGLRISQAEALAQRGELRICPKGLGSQHPLRSNCKHQFAGLDCSVRQAAGSRESSTCVDILVGVADCCARMRGQPSSLPLSAVHIAGKQAHAPRGWPRRIREIPRQIQPM